MTWFANGLTCFDTETSHLSPDEGRIVTATVAHVNGRQVDTKSWLIAVDVDIDPAAENIHGISTEHARANGRPAAEVVDLIAGELALSLSRQVPVVGMNLCFDWTFLDRELRRNGLPTMEDRLDGRQLAPVFDVFVLDKQIDRYRKGSRKLEDLCKAYDVRIDGAHDAEFDALAAGRIAWRMAQRTQMDAAALRGLYADRKYPDALVKAWQQLGRMSLTELHERQVQWYRDQSESLGQYWRGQAEQKRAEASRDSTSDEDREIALQEAAELDTKVDSLRSDWPLIPHAAEEASK